VITVIPYTSIIEQTAAVYRGLLCPAFGNDLLLEHHSALVPALGADSDGLQEQRHRLATQNWDAPLVVTTSLQFFESLFTDRPSRARKLHNIARSVLIFDEVQTLPSGLLPSLLSAVSLLTSEPYGCTALFMTATQPAFATAASAVPWSPAPIVVSSANELPRRTCIRLPAQDESWTWEQVASRMTTHRQALCVVNTTGDARALFRLLESEGSFHLSGRLCPAHRRRALLKVREALAAGQPCRLVSTQVIEAGVDVDFPVAYRALGPLDSIVQTAGRCNREGRAPEPGAVTVFRPADGGMPPGAYKTAAQLTEGFLERHADAARRLDDPALYAEYFRELYHLIGPESAEHDPVYCASRNFNFPKASESCHLIDKDTQAVLVAWEDGADLIAWLRSGRRLSPADWRRVQRLSVNLYAREFDDARAHGYVVEIISGVWAWNSHYDSFLGACHPEGRDLCV
jgi:CRISPR-associated endonuclease/helicase Cas3